MVGAQGGPVRDSSSQQPGHTGQGGWGVKPRRWLMLKVGVRGVVVPNGPNTTA